MKKADLIEQLAAENDGILFAHDAYTRGISRENLRQATVSGKIENIGHGVYISKGTLPDDSFILQKKYNTAIFSHETAAYFLGYTTRDPLVYCVTVPSGHNSKLLSQSNVKVYYSKEIRQEDIAKVITMFGRTVRCFNIEKTICDLCSPRFNGDKDVALEIIKTYARSDNKDISKLMSYATTEKIKKTVRGYMEVLL
ncbi:MAG: type IV toxin-antitoxin system AbiEi family antitoxin domain-containing protein [Leptospirales bacterium]|nr:type IV toxin-antitoxin system AbiEi family antitoxin domain-containing protein [Leptospirales bacterium]